MVIGEYQITNIYVYLCMCVIWDTELSPLTLYRLNTQIINQLHVGSITCIIQGL